MDPKLAVALILIMVCADLISTALGHPVAYAASGILAALGILQAIAHGKTQVKLQESLHPPPLPPASEPPPITKDPFR